MISEKRDLAIDGLRGLGALFVVFVHIAAVHPVFNHGPGYAYLTQLGSRTMGVFFCLSGLLVYGALVRLQLRGFSYRKFFLRRAFRLLPLWWFTLAVLFLYQKDMSARVLIANMFLYMGNLQSNSPYLALVASWTLFVEEIFYVAAPFIFRFLNLRATVVSFFAALAVSTLWRSYALKFAPASWDLRMDGVWRSPLANFQYFFLGVLLYHLIYGIGSSSFQRRWPRPAALALDLFAVVAFGDLLAPWGIHLPWELGIALLVVACVRREGFISYLVRRPVLVQCGMWCYGIYILQESVYVFTHWIYAKYGPEIILTSPTLDLTATLVVQLCALIPAAALAFKWIESPMIDLGKRLSARFDGEKTLSPPKSAPASSSDGHPEASTGRL